MKLLMIGGHSRNIGKTSVVAGIISALPEYNWTAVKITQFGHGVCSVNGSDCGCETSEHQFAITTERNSASGSDTARFLAAGARRSLWVRTKQGELVTALPALRAEIANEAYVIVESNSLRRFIKPDFYLQVLDPANPDFKTSAQEMLDLADALLIVSELNSVDEARAQLVNAWPQIALARTEQRPAFAINSNSDFITTQLIEFVKRRL